MKILTVSFGLLLMILGGFAYAAPGESSLTPVWLGLFITILGGVALQNRWKNDNPLFGSLMLAFLGFLSSAMAIYNLLTGAETGQAVLLRSIIGVACVVFIVLGVVLIKDFWQGWKAFGHFLGDLVARVALTFFYFTIFVPFAIGVRLFTDPLHIKTTPAKLWRDRATGDQQLEEVLRQF